MKVTMFSSWPPMRGISPYTHSLARVLGRACAGSNDDLTILTFRRFYPKWLYPGGNPLSEDTVDTHIPSVGVRREVDFMNPFSWSAAGKRTDTDVLHVQHWAWPLGPAGRMLISGYQSGSKSGKRHGRDARRKVVITLHNLSPHNVPRGGVKNFLYRLPWPLADAWIVHHDAMADALQADPLSHGAPIHVIPHIPIEQSGARAMINTLFTESGRRQARKSLKWPADARIALLFGNLRPYKGLDTAVEAIALANRATPCMLVIAGEPWMPLDDIRERVRRLGISDSVRWELGHHPDETLLKMIMSADMILAPHSQFGSASGVVTLVGYGGCPALLSDLPGLHLDDVVSARFLPPRHAPVWADAIAETFSALPSLSQRRENALSFLQNADRLMRDVAERHWDVYRSV